MERPRDGVQRLNAEVAALDRVRLLQAHSYAGGARFVKMASATALTLGSLCDQAYSAESAASPQRCAATPQRVRWCWIGRGHNSRVKAATGLRHCEATASMQITGFSGLLKFCAGCMNSRRVGQPAMRARCGGFRCVCLAPLQRVGHYISAYPSTAHQQCMREHLHSFSLCLRSHRPRLSGLVSFRSLNVSASVKCLQTERSVRSQADVDVVGMGDGAAYASLAVRLVSGSPVPSYLYLKAHRPAAGEAHAEASLFVAGLPFCLTQSNLERLFGAFGDVEQVRGSLTPLLRVMATELHRFAPASQRRRLPCRCKCTRSARLPLSFSRASPP